MADESDIKKNVIFFKYLKSVFDFSIINSLLIVSESIKFTLEYQKSENPQLKVVYVKPSDWVTKTNTSEYYDLVIYEKSTGIEIKDDFFAFLTGATGDVLILSGCDKNSKGKTITKIESNGLSFWKEAGDKLPLENMLVFKRNKFSKINSTYFMQGINTDNTTHKKILLHAGLYKKSLQEKFIDLTRQIKILALGQKGKSIIRASDGDYFFLRKIALGSAKPGRRALTKQYDQLDMNLYRRLFWQNDLISVSIEKPMVRAWKNYVIYDLMDRMLWKIKFNLKGHKAYEVISLVIDKYFSAVLTLLPLANIFSWFLAKRRGIDYKEKSQLIIIKEFMPMEVVYALVATKWIFKNFKNQVGVIGNEAKLEVMQKLMQYQEYKDYLGMDYFTDYVPVPQKGAADDLEGLAKKIGKQIKTSKAKVFLLGIGSVKLGLMPLIKAYSDAIFIDVGCGIDALAGVLCQDRPYFADWVDYRLKDYDYSKVDFMDQGNPAWNNPEFKTVWL